MAETTTQRKRRNSRLTAYYGLEAASAKPTGPTPTSPPPPKDRETALAHAAHLTRTLSLPSLLSHTTILQKNSQSLQTSLHASVRHYYKTLSQTIDAAQSATNHPTTLSEILPTLSTLHAQTSSINANLAPTRAAIDSLEAARRATLLQSAASHLADTLLPAYNALTALCTDPVPARTALFLTARRTAVILPAVTTLSNQSPQFATPAAALQSAVDNLLAQLAVQDDPADPYGLDLPDRLRLRSLLGDSPASLHHAFCHHSAQQLCASAPTDAALAAAAPDPLAIARVQLSFSAQRIVPQTYDIARQYAEIFHNRDWETFVVWLSDALDEAVAARVRRALRDAQFGGDALRERAQPYSAAIDHVLAASAAAAAKARDGAGDDAERAEAAARVEHVFRAMCEQLRSGLLQSISQEAAARWRAIVDEILTGARGVDGAEEVIRVVRDICGSSEWVTELDGGTACSEEKLLREVTRYAIHARSVDLASCGRAGALCRALSRRCSGSAASALRMASERIFERVGLQVVEGVLDVFAARLEAWKGGLEMELQEDANKAVELLRAADDMGRECDVPALLCGPIEAYGVIGGDELLLGEDDSVAAGVLRGWTELVRGWSFGNEDEVRRIQVEAYGVGAGIGRVGFFEKVGQAGLERCAEKGAKLLDEDEVREGWKRWTASLET